MTPLKLPRLAQSVHSSPSTLLLILGTVIMLAVLLTSDQKFFVADAEASVADAGHQQSCANSAKDMVTIPSQYGVAETVARLQIEIQARELGVLSVIDHAAASGTGEPLRPTTLILFGSPDFGASLLRSEQSIGIDLPLKYLVWQNACDQVYIGYMAIGALQKRHKIRELDDAVQAISDMMSAIALPSALRLE